MPKKPKVKRSLTTGCVIDKTEYSPAVPSKTHGHSTIWPVNNPFKTAKIPDEEVWNPTCFSRQNPVN